MEERLEAIRSRESASDANSAGAESPYTPTGFEKSLFVDGVVDWRSYVDQDELFSLLNDEAINGVDVRFAKYQDALLHLLQHCYGCPKKQSTEQDTKANIR